jgi:4-hydroxy-tetrahydrodipicolinate synthase
MITAHDPPRITGIVPPMVTPIAGRDKLDIPGLEKLIEHILAGGVHGLFILGTTGEAPSLGYAVRRELIERTCKQVNRRVPVLVGVTDTAYSESLTLARHAERCGADAVVIAPPYYFPAGQPELLEYFQSIVSAMPLPVMLYNMPACTKINIELDTLRHMLDHPKVIGFKDSSGQMVYFHGAARLFADHPGKTLLVGAEEMLGEAVMLGGHGGICGGANLFPKLYVDLYHAATSDDLATVKRLHELVIRITALYRVGRYTSSTIKGVKCALACMGICEDYLAEPFHRFREHERTQVRKMLAELTPMMSGCMAGA